MSAERVDVAALIGCLDRHFVSGRVHAILRYERRRAMWMAKARAESDRPSRSDIVRWAREANHDLLREIRGLHKFVASVRGEL